MKLNYIINLIIESPNSPRGYVELLKYYQQNNSAKNIEVLEHLIRNKFNESFLPTNNKE